MKEQANEAVETSLTVLASSPEFLSAIVGAIVGAIAGGLIAWLVQRQALNAANQQRQQDHLEARRALALQLRFSRTSESMGHHDSEVMDDGSIDRGNA